MNTKQNVTLFCDCISPCFVHHLNTACISGPLISEDTSDFEKVDRKATKMDDQGHERLVILRINEQARHCSLEKG